MKRIISGKRYDTDTAKNVSEYWNGLSESDFRSCTEYLYQKRTGEFFIYGEGGAMTRWATSHGNTSSRGRGILPLTLEMAKEWVESCNNERYEEIFGEAEE